MSAFVFKSMSKPGVQLANYQEKKMKLPLCINLISLFIFVTLLQAQTPEPSNSKSPEETILKAEKEALERWRKGDVYGYIRLGAENITYFDPGLEKRLEGAEAFKKYLEPINGTFSVYRFDMIEPQVRINGDVGILTFNLNSLAEDGKITSRWNTTEIYQKIGEEWKIIHSHWSNTTPGK
jgi:ketosteroid isomerase-like protein